MNPFTFQSFVAILFPAETANPTGPQVLAGTFNAYGPEAGPAMRAIHSAGPRPTHNSNDVRLHAGVAPRRESRNKSQA